MDNISHMISPWFSQLFSSQQAAQEVERRAFCRQEELEARFEDGGMGPGLRKREPKRKIFSWRWEFYGNYTKWRSIHMLPRLRISQNISEYGHMGVIRGLMFS